MVKTRDHAPDVVRAQHWVEIAEFLGQPVQRAKETFLLYLRLLGPLGYHLHRAGEEPEAAAPVKPEELTVDRALLFDAVEGALIDIEERTAAGERVSDQAEVRAIVTAVMNVLDPARVGA